MLCKWRYFDNVITSKLDLGVHNRLDIEQEEYCFDIAFDEEGASLLINSNEQMFAEKLFLIFKAYATTIHKSQGIGVSDCSYAIRNVTVMKRNTLLKERLFDPYLQTGEE